MELEVTIGIKDGLPYIIENNSNVKVKILDYDVEGHYDKDELDTDQFGNKYIYDEIQ